TIFLILYSLAVTIAAMALCSAQNPVPEPVSIQTPEYWLPLSVMSVEPTSPKRRSPTRLGLRTRSALPINSSFVIRHVPTAKACGLAPVGSSLVFSEALPSSAQLNHGPLGRMKDAPRRAITPAPFMSASAARP